MQTTMREKKLNGLHPQIIATSEKSKTGGVPARATSTAQAFVGLTHLLHQINNPIQLVYGATGLMDQEIANANGRENPSLSQVFQTLKGGVDQLISMVGSLRSQMECLWQIDPPFNSVNLNLVINEVLQGEAARLASGGIHVRRCIATNLPPIQANEKLLKKAFVNLLRNAAEAMPEGGVLSVRTGARERSVFLEIADTGLGVAPDLDIFQPFVTSKAGAMGLGLTIARHIVEIHDGSIVYRSQGDRGTTFCLDFSWAPESKEGSA